MSLRATSRCAALLAAALLALPPARAFSLLGNSWADGNIVMHLQLGAPSSALTDGAADWGAVAESALNEWNTQLGRARFTAVRDSAASITRGNRVNNVVFRPDIFGSAFGERTLAVTIGASGGAFATSETDVVFNSNLTWNSYRGVLRSTARDFRRVALHEFGHVLGLDHPDEASAHFQNVDAIMNSTASNTEVLRPDDIAGARALYDITPDRTLPVGTSFTLSAPASGNGFTYTWFFRAAGSTLAEAFRLATGPSYTIGSVQLTDAGTYVAMATSPAGTFTSSTAILNVTPVATSSDTALANISTRGVVGTGSGVLIAGLVISGTAPKTVFVRAAGPALADFGVAGALGDPVLTITNGAGQTVAQNDNWEVGGNAAAISAAATQAGAFQFKPGGRDAALVATLPPGNYSAVVSGAGNTTGIALVEAYDIDPANARGGRLLNIATRGQVRTGEDVLIAGLVVRGPGPRTYLIRAVGPTLIGAPFSITDALRDPFLQVFQGDKLLRESDDIDTPIAGLAGLRAAAQRVGAFTLRETRIRATSTDPGSGLDAAMLITLEPGAYTAKVSGFQGATGVALIEIYEMP